MCSPDDRPGPGYLETHRPSKIVMVDVSVEEMKTEDEVEGMCRLRGSVARREEICREKASTIACEQSIDDGIRRDSSAHLNGR